MTAEIIEWGDRAEELTWSECSLVAACIERPNTLSELNVDARVLPGDAKVVIQAIQSLVDQSQAVDVGTVANRCQELAGRCFKAYLLRVGSEGTPINPGDHYAILTQRAKVFAARSIGRDLANDGDTERAQSRLQSLGQHGVQRYQEPAEALADYLAWSQEDHSKRALSTGLADVDRLLGGVYRSDLLVVGGRPGLGKTSLGLNLAYNCQRPALFVSAEQPKNQLMARLVSQVGEVSSQKLRNQKTMTASDWDKHAKGVGIVRDTSLISWTEVNTVDAIRNEARRSVLDQGVQMVVIDYLQRLQLGKGERHETVGLAAQAFKQMALELNVCVVLLAQLNRNAANEDRRPRMSELKESGGIEQEADVIFLIHEDEAGHEIVIDKNRHGQTGIVELMFQKEYTRFVSKHRGSWE